MDINSILRLASKYVDIDIGSDAKADEEFRKSVAQAAGSIKEGFGLQTDVLSQKKQSYDAVVLGANRECIVSLAGSIDISFGFLACIDVVQDTSAQRGACLAILRTSLKIAQEILCLLESGFADGGLARWRSLFEHRVILRYLQSTGEEVSRRFLDHNSVIRTKLGVEIEKAFNIGGELGWDQKYEELLKRYGDEYREPYGWLAPEVSSRNRRNFANLCKLAGNPPETAIYKLASEVLHSNSFSALASLGNWGDTVAVGPSKEGVRIPAMITVHTLLAMFKESIEHAFGGSNVGLFLSLVIVNLLELVFRDARSTESGGDEVKVSE